MGYQLNIETTDDSTDDTCWHRSSNLGMGSICRTMREFGMLTDWQPLEFPPLSDFGLTRDDFTSPGQVAPGKSASLTAAQAAGDAVRSAAEPDPAGIPHYKLGSHLEHWLIVPAEIRAALAAYDAQPAEHRKELEDTYPAWAPWLAFLRRATGHLGIRVY